MVRRLIRSFLPLVSGVTGVTGAHLIAYLLSVPSPEQRAGVLLASGHGYWDHAMVLGVVAGVLAVAHAFVRGVRRGKVDPAQGQGRFSRRLLMLASWQLALFVGMEVIERVVAGVDPKLLLETPAFALGILLQLAVAAAILLILDGFEHLVATVACRLRRPPSPVRRLPNRPRTALAPASRRFSLASPRAPPVPVTG